MIELKDISKSFRLYTQNSAKITVFKDVNLTVNRGELVAFTGKSGSGKTTLMKMIYGVMYLVMFKILRSQIYNSLVRSLDCT